MTTTNKKLSIIFLLAAILLVLIFTNGNFVGIGTFFLLILYIFYIWVLKTDYVKDHEKELKTKYNKPKQPWKN